MKQLVMMMPQHPQMAPQSRIACAAWETGASGAGSQSTIGPWFWLWSHAYLQSRMWAHTMANQSWAS